MTSRLGEQEWIDAALRTLARRGVDAVRVERLAKDLKVTKGSFYWHFKDRAALLKAVLEAWRSRATSTIIAEVEAKSGDARRKLDALLAIAFVSDGRLELAVRVWAARDALARTALVAVDRRRVGYLASLFAEIGLSAAESQARARFVYCALLGRFAMAPRRDKASPDVADLAAITGMLTAVPSRRKR